MFTTLSQIYFPFYWFYHIIILRARTGFGIEQQDIMTYKINESLGIIFVVTKTIPNLKVEILT